MSDGIYNFEYDDEGNIISSDDGFGTSEVDPISWARNKVEYGGIRFRAGAPQDPTQVLRGRGSSLTF
jgi:hypothetical protein